jgi:hypothetical protein
MLGLVFLRSKSDQCKYCKHDGGNFLVITLYIDDLLLLSNNKYVVHDLKSQLSTQFDMKEFRAAKYILGMEIRRDRENRKVWLSQSM